MQVLLGAATLFFCCCCVVAFGFQDLDLRTWVSGPRYLALKIWVSRLRQTDTGFQDLDARMHARVGVMAAGSRWSVISVAGSAIENAPKTSSNKQTNGHNK
jgi:hypothetical protein